MKNIKNETYANLLKLQEFVSNNDLSYYQNIHKIVIDENQNLNENKIKNYNKIISEIAKNLEIIAIPNNSISYSYVLFLFLHTGYLSKNSLNKKNKENYEDVVGYLGLDVIKGEACCRHVASLHEDVFSKIGIIGNLISTSTDNVNNEFNEKANHSINIIKYKDIYYAHDILNGSFYYFETPLVLKSINPSIPLELRYQMYKPIEDIKLWGKNQNEIMNMIDEINNSNKEEYLSIKEFNEIIEATKVRFFGSFKELEKYKKKTKLLFWKISSKIFN